MAVITSSFPTCFTESQSISNKDHYFLFPFKHNPQKKMINYSKKLRRASKSTSILSKRKSWRGKQEEGEKKRSIKHKKCRFDLIFSLIQIRFNYNIKSKNTHLRRKNRDGERQVLSIDGFALHHHHQHQHNLYVGDLFEIKCRLFSIICLYDFVSK